MLDLAIDYLRRLAREAVSGWNRFWFSPQDSATLGLIRILGGAMLLYTHLVWTLRLDAFFGPDSWVSPEAASLAIRGGESNFAWSYWWLIDSPWLARIVHGAALLAFACLTIGLASRAAAVLSFVAAISYVNRVPGALFGLDQINCLLATYLMIGPCGDAWSVDRWLTGRRMRAAGQSLPPAPPSVSGNLAIRLIQVHMCVIYFFAGLSKLQGEAWWSGAALWGAIANLEYQSLDMTFLVNYPVIVALLTQVTVYWELSFCVFVWGRLTRPLVLALAIGVHLGIGLCMGMMTFGLVMLIGCTAFIPPWLVRRMITRKPGRVGEPQAMTAPAAPSRPVAKGRRSKFVAAP